MADTISMPIGQIDHWIAEATIAENPSFRGLSAQMDDDLWEASNAK
jgi:hypothetical protein